MSREIEPKKKTRIQLDISAESAERIEDIRESCDFPTRSAVIHKAVDVYEWLVKKAISGEDLSLSPADLRVITGLPQRSEKSQQAKNPLSSNLEKPV